MVTMIRYVIPTLAFVAGMGGMKNIIIQEIPDFYLQDGQFSLDERIEKEDEVNGIYVLCDTEVDKFTKEDIPQGMSSFLFALPCISHCPCLTELNGSSLQCALPCSSASQPSCSALCPARKSSTAPLCSAHCPLTGRARSKSPFTITNAHLQSARSAFLGSLLGPNCRFSSRTALFKPLGLARANLASP